MAFTKVVGAGIHTLSNITSHNINSSGIITATKFVGPMENGSGISTFYDLRVTNNLTVDGSTTTLDTDLIGVDRVEVAANSNSIVGVAITQSGSADIVNLFDGATKVVTVDDQGKIGLGTYVPEKLLHLETNSSTSGEEILRLENPHTDGKLTKIGFRTHGLSQPQTQILGGNDNSGEGGQIGSSGAGKFKVTVANPSGTHQEVIYAENDAGSKFTRLSSGGTEAIRILSTGNVGIGTDDPAKKLEVFDATQGVIRIRGGGGGSDTSRKADLSLFASGAREYVVRADASDAAFKIVDVSGSNAERFVITSGGDVGIGTVPVRRLSLFDTAACVLELNSTNSGGTSLRIQHNHADKMLLGLAGDFIIGQGSNVTDSAIRNEGALLFATGGGNEKVRITSGGSVLIDTTVTTEASADGNDIIIGSTSDTQKGISIVGSTTNGVGNIFFTDGASYKNQGIIQYRHVDDSMRFTTAQYERLRITSGNVKFWGTTTADDTNKSVNLTAPSYDTGEEDVNLVQVENESGFNQISFGGGTSGLNAATTLRFLTASAVNTTTGSERLRITSGGKVKIANHGTNDLRSLSVLAPQTQIQFGAAEDVGGFLMSTNNGQFGLSAGGYWNGSSWVAKHTASAQIRTDGDADISFCTNTSLTSGNTFTPSEKMTIKSDGQVNISGNLAIGTATAVRHLTIKDPGQIHVESTATGSWVGMSIKGSSGTNNYDAYFGILDSNGNFFIDNGSDGDNFVITQDGQLTHTANKNSGFTARFVQSHADNPALIEIDSPSNNHLRPSSIKFMAGGVDKWGVGEVYNPTSQNSFHICTGSASQANSKVMITSAGRVGVGTYNPQAYLDVISTDILGTVIQRNFLGATNTTNTSSKLALTIWGKNHYDSAYGSTGTDAYGPMIGFGGRVDGAAPNTGDIRAGISYKYNGGLTFHTEAGGSIADGTNETLRITSKGTTIAYHGAAPSDALTYPSAFRSREGVVGPIFYWPRVYGAHDKGGGYTNLIEGGRLSLRMYGAQGGVSAMFHGGFGVTFGGAGEAIEYNRVRVIFRVTRDGTTEGYEQDSITFKMQQYYYSGGWTDISGSSWNFTGMDSERGYRWTASNWISSADFAGGFDVPSIAIVYDTDNGNASNHNVRIAAVYLQYARFSS